MFAIGLLVGYRPTTNIVYLSSAIALMLLISFAFSWVSATIGLLVHSVEAAQSAGFIWLFPLTFASSAFVLVATLPNWLRAFSERQPVTLMVNAVRGLLLGHPAAADVWGAVAWSLGILLVFIPLSVWMYGRRVGR
jgi:ABC-type uncharacterized transport system permease subunit